MQVPGVGPVAAGTIRALAGDVTRFRRGRDFAAWLGLTPRQNSSGDKVRIGVISKAGNRELRTLLVMSQLAVLRRALDAPAKASPWLTAMIKRRPRLVVAVAMAAKTARVSVGHAGARRGLPAAFQCNGDVNLHAFQRAQALREQGKCSGDDDRPVVHRGQAKPAKRMARQSAFR
jgi:Transposase IS116/IS110/IS902 family